MFSVDRGQDLGKSGRRDWLFLIPATPSVSGIFPSLSSRKTLGLLVGCMAIHFPVFLSFNCGYVICSSLGFVRENDMSHFPRHVLKGRDAILFVPLTSILLLCEREMIYLFKGTLTQVSISCS